jgi:hypothetical protein
MQEISHQKREKKLQTVKRINFFSLSDVLVFAFIIKETPICREERKRETLFVMKEKAKHSTHH